MTNKNIIYDTNFLIVIGIIISIFLTVVFYFMSRGVFDKDDSVEYDPNKRPWKWIYFTPLHEVENNKMGEEDIASGQKKHKKSHKKSHKKRK